MALPLEFVHEHSLVEKHIARLEVLRRHASWSFRVTVPTQARDFDLANRACSNIHKSLTTIFELKSRIPHNIFSSLAIVVQIVFVLETLQQSCFKGVVEVTCPAVVSCIIVSIVMYMLVSHTIQLPNFL